MRTVITTVGTSLITNARDSLGLKDGMPTDQQIANYIRHAASEKASAETNSLSRLLVEGDSIVFLHSQTEEGLKCAEALRRHFAHKGYRAELREVKDLLYTESRFKMRGLRSLVSIIIDIIRKEKKQGRKVVLNATGGFKAEIAYATLVGLLFDIPVYYIHEIFKEIIEMPATPISWDYSLMADNEEFFEWLYESERPTPEVDARLKSLPPEIRLLLVELEDVTTLSPAGEAFYEAYLHRVETSESVPVLLSSTARKVYNASQPTVRHMFDRTIKKLRIKELRVAGSDRVNNSDCLVFPKGNRDERLFYFETELGEVYVCALSRHTDKSYERLIEKGVRCSGFTDFQPWKA